MSEQIVDLRSVWAILRRHARALAVAAVVGGAAGAAGAQSFPSGYSSITMVLFPATTAETTAASNAHAIDTQRQIAMSDTVLGRAGLMMRPTLTAAEVADRLSVEAPTGDVLTITARSANPAEAEALATAVATADIDYLRAAASGLSSDQRSAIEKRRSTLTQSLEAVRRELAATSRRLETATANSAPARSDAATLSQLTARQADLVLQADAVEKQLVSQSATTLPGGGPRLVGPASPAQAPPPALRGAAFAALGAGLALVAGAALAILLGRREKSLRSRDQIADSIGIPVVASVECRTPRSVAGWVTLLRSYSPASTDAWALHQLLHRFAREGGEPPNGPNGGQPGIGRRSRAAQEGRRAVQVLVLTLGGDQQALSFGPQLASFAAGTGRETCLMTATQRQEATNALRAASSRLGAEQQPRPGLLVRSQADGDRYCDLAVHCVTVPRQRPGSELPSLDDAVTLLAVSSGGASAEDLARLALAADDAGVPLEGIVVVNPDPLDRTSGRLLPSERRMLAPLPSLMTGASGQAKALPTAAGRKR